MKCSGLFVWQPAALVALFYTVLMPLGNAAAGPLMCDVTAKVQGFDTPQKIGTITVDGGFRMAGLKGTFSFAPAFSGLNCTYDFDWVQVVTNEKGDNNFFDKPKPPAIDPRIKDNPDKYPFYYSKKEWSDNKFAGQTIHKDGEFSTFLDVPAQPKGTIFSFSTFLVARDRGQYTLNGEMKFSALAGFTWEFVGDGIDPDKDLGKSTPLDCIKDTSGAEGKDLINTAIMREAEFDDAFDKWKNAALGPIVLAPEPGSIVLLGMGSVILLGYLWRHKRAA